MKKIKINDLPKTDRIVVLGILRGLLAKNGLAKKDGLERTEELAIKLLDKGHLKIHFDGEKFWLQGTKKGKDYLNKKLGFED